MKNAFMSFGSYTYGTPISKPIHTDNDTKLMNKKSTEYLGIISHQNLK